MSDCLLISHGRLRTLICKSSIRRLDVRETNVSVDDVNGLGCQSSICPRHFSGSRSRVAAHANSSSTARKQDCTESPHDSAILFTERIPHLLPCSSCWCSSLSPWSGLRYRCLGSALSRVDPSARARRYLAWWPKFCARFDAQSAGSGRGRAHMRADAGDAAGASHARCDVQGRRSARGCQAGIGDREESGGPHGGARSPRRARRDRARAR